MRRFITGIVEITTGIVREPHFELRALERGVLGAGRGSRHAGGKGGARADGAQLSDGDQRVAEPLAGPNAPSMTLGRPLGESGRSGYSKGHTIRSAARPSMALDLRCSMRKRPRDPIEQPSPAGETSSNLSGGDGEHGGEE